MQYPLTIEQFGMELTEDFVKVPEYQQLTACIGLPHLPKGIFFKCLPVPHVRVPPAQLGKGDGEAFAEPLHSGKTHEILRQDTEDEEQAVAGVGDDEVREDGMGMAAGTDQAHYAEAVADGDTAYEIDQGMAVIGMDAAGAFCSTAGICLKYRAESRHERVEQDF